MARLDRCLDLANILENEELAYFTFDMSVLLWSSRPTTCQNRTTIHIVGCIAGAVLVAAYGSEATRFGGACGTHTAFIEAGRILELTADQREMLFTPSSWMGSDKFPLSKIVRVLRHFGRTGEIDWSR